MSSGSGGRFAAWPPVPEIARSVVHGERRAGDVLADHLARQRASGPGINALVQGCPTASEDAAAVDAAVDAGRAGGLLLAGVPVSVKECFAVRGLVTTLGIASRHAERDGADCALVTRLRQAGAVIVGKANVPQAMFLHETDNPVWGLTRNPRDASRGPGGSSGGDAALVAAGIVPLAAGTDLAGSLRQPANSCGVAAIMPRSAVVGDGGALDTMPGLRGVRPRAGFIARTAGDLAVALAATGTVAEADGSAIPGRVAWWDETGPIPPSPAVRRAVREAVARLESSGVETCRVPSDLASEAAWLMLGIVSADGGDDVRRLFGCERPMPGVARLLGVAGMPRRMRRIAAAGLSAVGRRIEAAGVLRTGRRTAAGLSGLLASRDSVSRRLADLVDGCGAIVCPVSSLPALRHGAAARLVLAAAPCLLANLLDLPAGAVPVTTVLPGEQGRRGWSVDPVLRAAAATDRGSEGLPVGVQVIACPGGDEAAVLGLMRLIERPSPERP